MTMMRCVKPLIYPDKYGQHRFTPGISFAAADSDYVRRYPLHFEPAEDQRSAMRGDVIRVTAPANLARPPTRPQRDDLGREPWRLAPSTDKCSMPADLDRTTARLASAVHRKLLDIVRSTTGRDGCESGGLIFGRGDDRLIEAVEISGPGPNAIREPDRYRGDPEYDIAALSASRFDLLGTWHVHPGATRLPSAADLEVYGSSREALPDPRLAFIVVPTVAGGWDIEGFVVRRGYGRDQCRRARIT